MSTDYDFDQIYDDWIECDHCGGEGRMEDECECECVADICFCETPRPRRCYMCRGAGGWHSKDNEQGALE